VSVGTEKTAKKKKKNFDGMMEYSVLGFVQRLHKCNTLGSSFEFCTDVSHYRFMQATTHLTNNNETEGFEFNSFSHGWPVQTAEVLDNSWIV
jgi:hypothetical protein